MKKLICLMAIGLSMHAMAFTGTLEDRTLYDDMSLANPRLQEMLSTCGGPQLDRLIGSYDKVKISRNGKKLYLYDVKTKWVAAPGTFGELGGEKEISSKLKYIIRLDQGQCFGKKATTTDRITPRNTVDLTYADEGLFQCSKQLAELSENHFMVGDISKSKQIEGEEKYKSNDLFQSTQERLIIDEYTISDRSGRIVGSLFAKVHQTLEFTYMSTVEIEYTDVNKGCVIDLF